MSMSTPTLLETFKELAGLGFLSGKSAGSILPV